MFKEIVKSKITNTIKKLSSIKLNQFFEGAFNANATNTSVCILRRNDVLKGYILLEIFPEGTMQYSVFSSIVGNLEHMQSVYIYKYKEIDVKLEVLGDHIEET